MSRLAVFLAPLARWRGRDWWALAFIVAAVAMMRPMVRKGSPTAPTFASTDDLIASA